MEFNIDNLNGLIRKIESNVDYMEIRASKGNGTSIIMKDNKIQEINTGITIGARIRVLKNGAWGFAYTNDLRKLEEISKKAISISNSLNSDVVLSDEEIVEDKIKTKCKIPVSSVDIEEKIDLIKDTSKGADLEDLISIGINLYRMPWRKKNYLLSCEMRRCGMI